MTTAGQSRKPAPGADAAGASVLTGGQELALARLVHAWEMRQAAPVVAGVRPRPHPLLVGPSGSGKTFLAGELARRLGLPLFTVTTGGWIVHGAREPRYTLAALAEFIEDNPRGVILIDEIDKLDRRHAAESAWAASVQQEVFALLDGDQRLDQLSFPAGLRMKLGRGFLVVGAGAWQTEASVVLAGEDLRPPCGFGPSSTMNAEVAAAGNSAGPGCRGPDDFARRMAARLMAQESVAEELLFRFALPPVALGPPETGEVCARIVTMHAELGIAPPDAAALRVLGDQALASRRAARWLEGYAGELLWGLRGRLDLCTLSARGNDDTVAPPKAGPGGRAMRREQSELLGRFVSESRVFADALWQLDMEVTPRWRRLRRADESDQRAGPSGGDQGRSHHRHRRRGQRSSDPAANFLRRLCADGGGGSLVPRSAPGRANAGPRPAGKHEDRDADLEDIFWLDALATPTTPTRAPVGRAGGDDDHAWEGAARLAAFEAALDQIESVTLTDDRRRGQLFADLPDGVARLVGRVEAALRDGLLPPGAPAADGTGPLRRAALGTCASWRRCAALHGQLVELAAQLTKM